MPVNRNVVLLVLDAVRKDFFDDYAKRIQERANVSYQQCRAVSPWTVPSHASMLAGELPSAHGVHGRNPDFSSLAMEDTFFSELPEYSKISVCNNGWVVPEFGWDRFFDAALDFPKGRYYLDGIDRPSSDTPQFFIDYLKRSLRSQHTIKSMINFGYYLQWRLTEKIRRSSLPVALPRLFDYAAKRIVRRSLEEATARGEPFFIFNNFNECHTPLLHFRGLDKGLHSVPNGWDTDEYDYWSINAESGEQSVHNREQDIRYHRELYGASLEYLDRVIDSYVRKLDERTKRETTVVVTSDHGECLGYPADDHLMEHGNSLVEGVMHVPLCVINPPAEASEGADEYVSHVDLGKLLVAIANDRWIDVSRSRIAGELVGLNINVDRHPILEGEEEYWNRMIRAVYEHERKIVWDSRGVVAAYELDDDRPNWQRRIDESASIPDWADEFFETDIDEYRSRSGWTTDEPGVEDSTKDRLRDMGYL